MLKRIAITSLAAAAVFSTATVAMAPVTPAAAQVSVTFGSPPPAPVYEVVPAPRAGYVWAPGHYRLINDRYVWTPGHWEVARVGYRYIPDTWERVISAAASSGATCRAAGTVTATASPIATNATASADRTATGITTASRMPTTTTTTVANGV